MFVCRVTHDAVPDVVNVMSVDGIEEMSSIVPGRIVSLQFALVRMRSCERTLVSV